MRRRLNLAWLSVIFAFAVIRLIFRIDYPRPVDYRYLLYKLEKEDFNV